MAAADVRQDFRSRFGKAGRFGVRRRIKRDAAASHASQVPDRQFDSFFDINGYRRNARGRVAEIDPRAARFARKVGGFTVAHLGPNQKGIHSALEKDLRQSGFVGIRIGTMRSKNQFVAERLEAFFQFLGQQGKKRIEQITGNQADGIAAPLAQPDCRAVAHVSELASGRFHSEARFLTEAGVSRCGVEDAGGRGWMNIRQPSHIFQTRHSGLFNHEDRTTQTTK